jgi:hypothetical protein
MNLLKGIKLRYIIPFFIIILAFISIHIVQAVAEASTTSELVVASQDYVDAKVSDLTSKINTLTGKVTDLTASNEALKQQINSLTGTQGIQFTVLELEAGKQLLAGAGAEIILRGGKAEGISGQYGGLSDVTSGSGTDIKTGDNIAPNHLLIVSREDGRGLKTDNKSWVVVRGTYTIK